MKLSQKTTKKIRELVAQYAPEDKLESYALQFEGAVRCEISQGFSESEALDTLKPVIQFILSLGYSAQNSVSDSDDKSPKEEEEKRECLDITNPDNMDKVRENLGKLHYEGISTSDRLAPLDFISDLWEERKDVLTDNISLLVSGLVNKMTSCVVLNIESANKFTFKLMTKMFCGVDVGLAPFRPLLIKNKIDKTEIQQFYDSVASSWNDKNAKAIQADKVLLKRLKSCTENVVHDGNIFLSNFLSSENLWSSVLNYISFLDDENMNVKKEQVDQFFKEEFYSHLDMSLQTDMPSLNYKIEFGNEEDMSTQAIKDRLRLSSSMASLHPLNKVFNKLDDFICVSPLSLSGLSVVIKTVEDNKAYWYFLVVNINKYDVDLLDKESIQNFLDTVGTEAITLAYSITVDLKDVQNFNKVGSNGVNCPLRGICSCNSDKKNGTICKRIFSTSNGFIHCPLLVSHTYIVASTLLVMYDTIAYEKSFDAWSAEMLESFNNQICEENSKPYLTVCNGWKTVRNETLDNHREGILRKLENGEILEDC